MTRRRDHLTADLFSEIPRPVPALPESMDFRASLSGLVGEMLARARLADPKKDRWGIAAEMSRLTGHDVSKLMLDGYTAESRDNFNLPLWLVPALETVCDSTDLTCWLAGVRGGRVLLGPEALDAEIGRLRIEEQRRAARRRELENLRRRVR